MCEGAFALEFRKKAETSSAWDQVQSSFLLVEQSFIGNLEDASLRQFVRDVWIGIEAKEFKGKAALTRCNLILLK